MGRTTHVRYLVSGINEYGDFNASRGTAAVVLKKARKLLQEGYVDVRICTPHDRVLLSDELDQLEKPLKETDMAKGQQRSNREAKKPKKEKIKVIAAAPSRKVATWQPDFSAAKKK